MGVLYRNFFPKFQITRILRCSRVNEKSPSRAYPTPLPSRSAAGGLRGAGSGAWGRGRGPSGRVPGGGWGSRAARSFRFGRCFRLGAVAGIRRRSAGGPVRVLWPEAYSESTGNRDDDRWRVSVSSPGRRQGRHRLRRRRRHRSLARGAGLPSSLVGGRPPGQRLRSIRRVLQVEPLRVRACSGFLLLDFRLPAGSIPAFDTSSTCPEPPHRPAAKHGRTARSAKPPP